jgi:phospholipid/cholesterol/gamma-HCH transport system substrate-binding protein
METKANYMLIGAATVAGAVLAMIFALFLTGAEFNRAYASYIIVFDGPVRGLARGGEVRFQGIKVGEVVDLRIDPTNSAKVLAQVRVDAATPVVAHSVGQLEPIGLTGVNLIQIVGAAKGDVPLRQALGQPPPRIRGEASEIDKILGASGDIAEQTSRALMRIQTVLSDENVARVNGIIADLKSITGQIEQQRSMAKNANQTLVALAEASRGFTRTAASIERLSEETRTSSTGVVAKAGETLEAYRSAAVTGQATLERTEEAAAILAEQSLPDVALAAQDLRRLSNTLENLAVNIERNPNQFVVGAERPTVKVKQ